MPNEIKCPECGWNEIKDFNTHRLCLNCGWQISINKSKTEKPLMGSALQAKHYQNTDQQPIEIMQRNLTPEEFKGFLKGNVIKYLFRSQYKGTEIQDLEKMLQYATWLHAAAIGEMIDPRKE